MDIKFEKSFTFANLKLEKWIMVNQPVTELVAVTQ